MPSYAFLRWQNDRLPRLSALEAQAAPIPPSVLADENLRALVAMLSAHFQGFCRDLYTEAADSVVRTLPPHLHALTKSQFMAQIALGTGNPNLQALIRDFERFGMSLRSELDTNPANVVRLNHLALMNQWRNFVVHHGVVAPPGPPLDLPMAQTWQHSCDGLATELDRIVYDYLRATLGAPPW